MRGDVEAVTIERTVHSPGPVNRSASGIDSSPFTPAGRQRNTERSVSSGELGRTTCTARASASTIQYSETPAFR